MTPRFDPTRAIVYDLARGQLRDDEGASRLNLPVHLLVRLCESAGADAARDFGYALGEELGRRIADRMGDDRTGASIEEWTEHLGGQIALVGLGNLSVERWGKALVLRVAGPALGTLTLLEAVLAGCIQRGLGRQVSVVGFERGAEAEFLVLSGEGADKARQLAEGGAQLGHIVEELHKGAA
jgi:hypothetical protein